MASAAIAASSPSLPSPRKRASPMGGGGVDVAPRDLVESVGQSIALLASTLFASQVRNRQVLPLWLVHPLPVAESDASRQPYASQRDDSQELSRSATTWGELERQRTNRRRSNVQAAMSKRTGGLDMALDRQRQRMLDNLVPAATAAAGRRVPRASSALRSTVAAMRSSAESAVHRRSRSSPATLATRANNDAYLGATVDSFTTIVRALLLEPIDFTVTAGGGDDCSLHIFPFGDERLAQFNIPSSLLDVNELRALEYVARAPPPRLILLCRYLAMSSVDWVDVECYREDATGERLRASYIGNDAFDVALDRVRLVEALRETMLYGAGETLEVRHVVEAALVSAASRADIMDAGYHESLMRMAYATRMAPVPVPASPLERRSPLTVAAARERAYRLHIRTIDARVYHDMLQRQLVGDERAHARARAAAFGERRTIECAHDDDGDPM